MKEEGVEKHRNSSNFLNALNLLRAIALRLFVVFHSKNGVFHRNMQVFHNNFNNYRAKDYLYKLPVFWIFTAIFSRKSQGTRISTCKPKARNHLSG